MSDEPPPDHETPRESVLSATTPEDAAIASREPARGPRLWPRIVGVLLLLVGVGGVWVWLNPAFVSNFLPASATHDSEAAAIRTLEARVASLEQRPVLDAEALNQRIAAIDRRLAGQSPTQADPRPIAARLDALEARLNQAPAAGASQTSGAVDLQPLQARINALAAKVDALSSHETSDATGELHDLRTRIDALSAGQSKLASNSGQAARLARVYAAQIALAAGKPLGEILDAPPSVAKYAAKPPPTEAELRLGFASASREALKVSRPDVMGKPFVDQVLARLQDFRLITVREGDKVVIGNSDAATLARARTLLDAGDLDGGDPVGIKPVWTASPDDGSVARGCDLVAGGAIGVAFDG